jgi:hypothetical protein
MATWRNWAGDQSCSPVAVEQPTSLDDLREVVTRAAAGGGRVRASASGHSFTEIALTDGVMVRLDRLDRILDFDAASGLVRVEAGAVLRDLSGRLDQLGVAFTNLGDIDRQTLAGAISTGTHGTGARFQNIPAQIESIELVLADGTCVTLDQQSDPEGLRAARIGLGALGIIYAVTIRTAPAFCTGSIARGRWTRCWAASTTWPPPTTTSSSTCSPTRARLCAGGLAAPTSRPARAQRQRFTGTRSCWRTGSASSSLSVPATFRPRSRG